MQVQVQACDECWMRRDEELRAVMIIWLYTSHTSKNNFPVVLFLCTLILFYSFFFFAFARVYSFVNASFWENGAQISATGVVSQTRGTRNSLALVFISARNFFIAIVHRSRIYIYPVQRLQQQWRWLLIYTRP